MTQLVQLPPGCAGLDPGGGQRPIMADRPGGHVTISDAHADALNEQPGNGTAGVVNGRPGMVLATRKGQRCPACDRRWQAWTTECGSRTCQAREGRRVPTVPE